MVRNVSYGDQRRDQRNLSICRWRSGVIRVGFPCRTIHPLLPWHPPECWGYSCEHWFYLSVIVVWSTYESSGCSTHPLDLDLHVAVEGFSTLSKFMTQGRVAVLDTMATIIIHSMRLHYGLVKRGEESGWRAARVIYLLKLFIGHNHSACGQNMGFVDNTVSPWNLRNLLWNLNFVRVCLAGEEKSMEVCAQSSPRGPAQIASTCQPVWNVWSSVLWCRTKPLGGRGCTPKYHYNPRWQGSGLFVPPIQVPPISISGKVQINMSAAWLGSCRHLGHGRDPWSTSNKSTKKSMRPNSPLIKPRIYLHNVVDLPSPYLDWEISGAHLLPLRLCFHLSQNGFKEFWIQAFKQNLKHRHPPTEPHDSKVTMPQPTFILEQKWSFRVVAYIYLSS